MPSPRVGPCLRGRTPCVPPAVTPDASCAVLELYSEWCGPCKSVLPTFRRIRLDKDDEACLKFLVVRAPPRRMYFSGHGVLHVYAQTAHQNVDMPVATCAHCIVLLLRDQDCNTTATLELPAVATISAPKRSLRPRRRVSHARGGCDTPARGADRLALGHIDPSAGQSRGL